MKSMRRRVLVVYPRELADYDLFVEKIGKIDDVVADYSVLGPSDPRGFLIRLFGDRLESTNEQASHRRQRAALVQACTHIVVFWDGSAALGEFVFLAHLNRKKNWTIAIETTRVVNKDAGDEYDVYIGRRGPWGNPFAIGMDGTREEVIEKYKAHFEREFLRDESKRAGLLTLRGKRLGCHCKPAACHGDVIAEYLNSLHGAEATQRGHLEFADDHSSLPREVGADVQLVTHRD